MAKLIRKTPEFNKWFRKLRDKRAQARVNLRIRRLERGNPGDVKSVGGGVVEMRIDYGPGYRLYYIQRGPMVIMLLIGGDKSSQMHDIAKAIELARGLEG